MARHYKQLDQSMRDRIAALLHERYSYRNIAQVLGVSHATISRELRRNSYGTDGRTKEQKHGSYDATAADHKAYVRRKYAKYQGKKIHENPRLEAFIVTNVQRYWNPDEMAGYMKKHQDKLGFYASKTAIYEWFDSIYGERYQRYLYSKRPNKPRRQKRADTAPHIPDRQPIADRPAEALDRVQVGHYEFDAIVGPKTPHASRAALAVVQERATRLLTVVKVSSLAPKMYAATIVQLATGRTDSDATVSPSAPIHTFTTDNGLENGHWQEITKATGATVYFTDPYCSCQKGGIENGNKLVRRVYPKGTDFAAVSQTEIDRTVRLINKKPRRCLGYKSALQLAKEKGLVPASGALRG